MLEFLAAMEAGLPVNLYSARVPELS